MAQASLNLRIDSDLKDEFMAAAKAMDRNGSQLIRDFMRETVRHQHDAWFREQVNAGITQADRNEVIPADTVEAAAIAWRAKLSQELTDK